MIRRGVLVYWCTAGIVTPCEHFLHQNIIYADCTNIGVSDKIYDSMIDTNVTLAYHTTQRKFVQLQAIKFYFENKQGTDF